MRTKTKTATLKTAASLNFNRMKTAPLKKDMVMMKKSEKRSFTFSTLRIVIGNPLVPASIIMSFAIAIIVMILAPKWVILCILFLMILIMYRYLDRKCHFYPSGPIGIPIFGNLFELILNNDTVDYVGKLHFKYGDISMIYLGFKPIIYLHSIEMVNKIFGKNGHNIIDRERLSETECAGTMMLKKDEMGLLLQSGRSWKIKRKLYQSILLSQMNSSFINKIHNYSFNKCLIPKINECIENNVLWYPHKYFYYVMFHVVYFSIFKKHINFNDARIEYLRNLVSKSEDKWTLRTILKWFYIWDLCIPQIKIFAKFWSETEIIHKEMDKWLLEHYGDIYDGKNIFDLKNVNDFVKYYYSDNTNHNLWDKHDLDTMKKIIIGQFGEFFAVAPDTTSNAAEYGTCLLASYPDIQELIYNELISVFNNNNINITDNIDIGPNIINQLHYLRAFLNETIRLASVATLGLPHVNINKSLKISDNIIIPKNSIILTDQISCNIYDKHWKENGHELNIYLWLDSNNKFTHKLNKNKNVSFGIGDRNCAGKSFAFRVLYLLFVKLIIKYKFIYPNHDQQKDLFSLKRVYKIIRYFDEPVGLKVIERK